MTPLPTNNSEVISMKDTKNYRTLTRCAAGKIYKVIEYKSGTRVETPVNQDGSVKWFDDSKLLKKNMAEV